MRLAQLHLPGLPTSERRIRERAKREHWPMRRAHRRGGGVEYEIDAALLRGTQETLALPATTGAFSTPSNEGKDNAPSGAAAAAVTPVRASDDRDDLHALPDGARTRAVARGEILANLRAHLIHHGATNSEIADFVVLYNTAAITVTPATRAAVATVSAPALKRWRRELARGGPAALAGRYGHNAGSGILDRNPAMREVVLGMIAQWPTHLRAPRVVEALRARFPRETIPAASTVRAFIQRWHREHPSVALAMRNPDRWKSTHRVKVAAAAAQICRLNQEWQIDGTPGDILLADAKRYHILALIDVYSRRVMYHVAPSESASAAVRLICRAMVAWGVPEIIHGDNGAGFISNYAARFLDDLHIQYVASPPFRPETKPFVESVIATMAHELLAMLPGFVGHSVAQRQELRARTSFAARFGAPPQKSFTVQLTAPELQERLDLWAQHQYGDRVHDGIGLAPNAAAAAWRGEVRRIADERALAILAEDAMARRIGRAGIEIAGARFVATTATIGAYVQHIGENCLVYPDPSGDMGRYFLFLDSPAGRTFLAIVENVERLGADRSELALIAREAQDRFIRERRAEMRRIKAKIKPETIVDEVLAHAAARGTDAASRMPAHDALVHETAALAAAQLAGQTLATPVAPVTYDAELLARADAIIADAEQTSSRFLTDDDLYQIWKEVSAARAAGRPVDAERAEYADRFAGSPAWETCVMLDDDGEIGLRRSA